MGNPLDPKVADTINRFVAQFPLPQAAGPEDRNPATGGASDAFEDKCRLWMLRLAQQIEYEHPFSGYGRKRADPGRPWTKDNLPRKTNAGLEGWDLMTGAGTGFPKLSISATSISLDGQYFEHVSPHNWLGVTEPVPAPVPVPTPTPAPTNPPSDMSAIISRLELIGERLSDLEANYRVMVYLVETLSKRPFPVYTGAVGRRLRLVPEDK